MRGMSQNKIDLYIRSKKKQKESILKVQNCPKCKKKPKHKSIFVRCENKSCSMKTLDYFTEDFWNSIRIAPSKDDVYVKEIVQKCGCCFDEMVFKKDWMNANFQKDKFKEEKRPIGRPKKEVNDV